MKKEIIIGMLLLPMLVVNPASSEASSAWSSRMVNRQREAIPKAISSYINVWVAGKPKMDYGEPLQKILRGQTLLLSYDVDITDDLMVADLFEENGKPVSYSLFASRLLYHELERETGWKPDRNAPLKNKEYVVTVKQTNIRPGQNQFHLRTQ